MTVQRWNDFLNSHHRPIMIFADVMEGKTLQQGFEVLRRLVVAMGFKGRFALFPEKGFIRVAFELETDAGLFVHAVKATMTAREDGWSSQWAFKLDKKAIASALELVNNLPGRRTAAPRTVTPWTPWTTSRSKGRVFPS